MPEAGGPGRRGWAGVGWGGLGPAKASAAFVHRGVGRRNGPSGPNKWSSCLGPASAAYLALPIHSRRRARAPDGNRRRSGPSPAPSGQGLWGRVVGPPGGVWVGPPAFGALCPLLGPLFRRGLRFVRTGLEWKWFYPTEGPRRLWLPGYVGDPVREVRPYIAAPVSGSLSFPTGSEAVPSLLLVSRGGGQDTRKRLQLRAKDLRERAGRGSREETENSDNGRSRDLEPELTQ